MRCEQFFDRLNCLMDDRLDVLNDFQLRAHANECSSCDAALKMSARLTQAVATDTRDSVAVVDRSSGTRSRSAVWGLLTSAALLLIAVSWGARPTNDPTVAESDVSQEKPAVTSPSESAPVMVATLSPVPSDTSELASFEDVAAIGRSQPAMLHPIFNLGLITRTDWALAIDEFALPIPGRAESIDASWLKTVTEGVSPVQESVNSTLERIRRSVSQVVVNG